MLGLKILKIKLAALLARIAVQKSAEEITKNKTRSPFLHFAKALGVTKTESFAYNGDVAVIVDNYETRVTHLPDDFKEIELDEQAQLWFDFEQLQPLTGLLKGKALEEQMYDASLVADDRAMQLLAFNRKQSLTANTETEPDRLEIRKIIQKLRSDKKEAETSFSVNIRDLSRVCDYLKKVGDDFVELKIANDGKMLIFTSKTLEEKEPHVECYLKIKWGKLFD